MYAVTQLSFLFHEFGHFLEDILFNLVADTSFAVDFGHFVNPLLKPLLILLKSLTFGMTLILVACHDPPIHLYSLLYLVDSSGFHELLQPTELVAGLSPDCKQLIEA